MNCAGIVQVPDMVLRRECAIVTDFSSLLRPVAERIAAAAARSGRVGVAAPQLGIPRRIFAIKTEIGTAPTVYMNARIVRSSGTQRGSEACLSIRDRWFDCTRADYVEVEYEDITGTTQTVEAEGLLARALQHEIDHLDGILFIDRVEQQARGLIRQQRRQIERQLGKIPCSPRLVSL